MMTRFGRCVHVAVLAAVLTWGLYSVLLRRWPVPVPGFTLLAAMLMCGVPLLLPFYLWELNAHGSMPWSPQAFGAIGYTAVMASLVAYSAWNHGVRVLGPATASLFSYLMPIFASLLGILLLGEEDIRCHCQHERKHHKDDQRNRQRLNGTCRFLGHDRLPFAALGRVGEVVTDESATG